MKYQIGDTVASEPIGSKESFVGKIVAEKDGVYVLRDAYNHRWYREESDLKPC